MDNTGAVHGGTRHTVTMRYDLEVFDPDALLAGAFDRFTARVRATRPPRTEDGYRAEWERWLAGMMTDPRGPGLAPVDAALFWFVDATGQLGKVTGARRAGWAVWHPPGGLA